MNKVTVQPLKVHLLSGNKKSAAYTSESERTIESGTV